MADHQELVSKTKVELEAVQSQFEALEKLGDTEGADVLLESIAGTAFIAAGRAYMAALRMRKAAHASGFRVGV